MNLAVWRCDLDRGIASLDMLDETERTRAAAFAFEHLRRRYIAAHCFLRTTLASALGATAQSLVFGVTGHGKPVLTAHDLAFNLSHSDSIAYLVLGGVDPIGIDVEIHKRIDDLMGVARTVFSAVEMAELETAAPPDRYAPFLRCWTRKEAYVKALGVGLSTHLCDITVRTIVEDVVVPPFAGISDRTFYIRSVATPFDEYVAIATAAIPRNVTVQSFPTV